MDYQSFLESKKITNRAMEGIWIISRFLNLKK
jgi:hypothetical protein